MATFTTAKQFASFMLKAWGAKYVKSLNEGDLDRRLSTIRDYCERAIRQDIYGDAALPFGYNPASYGLWWAVASGRVNGETVQVLRAMSMRELCELLHLLLAECGPTTSGYARFLMERFASVQ